MQGWHGIVTIAGMLFSDAAAGPAETLVAELRDYPEWHRGRHRYGVWVVPITQPELLAYIEQARARLADVLHPSLLRQPHLTVFVCGFHRPRGSADDDFSPHQLRRQIAALRSGAALSAELPLGRPDSFASAAFIPVADPDGQLAHWRHLLGHAAREVRPSPYVPHVTLGLYRRRLDADSVRERLGELSAPPGALIATELHYATYAARNQFGPLRSQRRCLLAASSMASG